MIHTLRTRQLALRTTACCALALSIVLVTGCKDKSTPTAPAVPTTPAAAQHDHAADAHDHATDASAKTAMGDITGGVPADVKLVNTICPVSGEHFDRNDKSISAVEIKGKTYGVCCSDCIEMFKKNPDKYLAKLDAATKEASEAAGNAKDAASDAVKKVIPAVTQ